MSFSRWCHTGGVGPQPPAPARRQPRPLANPNSFVVVPASLAIAIEPAGDRRWLGPTWRERGKGKGRISLGEKKSKGLAVWEFG